MKKMLSLAIALALCFSLCACVGNTPQGKSALDWDAMQEELQASSEVLTAQLTNFAFYSEISWGAPPIRWRTGRSIFLF